MHPSITIAVSVVVFLASKGKLKTCKVVVNLKEYAF
jgi:hypothetical protein